MSSPESRPASKDKPAVVGLYGLPGSGKTFLLNQLKQELRGQRFKFYEGSETIAALLPGGLSAFQELKEADKVHWRQLAIDAIGKDCAYSGEVAVVAGHFMFWPEGEQAGQPVYTRNDMETFTHILYLDVPAELLAQRRQGDMKRRRPMTSASHLSKWQQVEETELRRLCRENGILFSLVPSSGPGLRDKITTLLLDFQLHTEDYNRLLTQTRLDDILVASRGRHRLETVLVLDADRTLAAEDTGTLFWKMAGHAGQPQQGESEYPLKTLFSSPLGYSYTAFRQAMLLYEEAANNDTFDAVCEKVAAAVVIHPEFMSLLHQSAGEQHVATVVVSCGLRRVWDKVLEREGLSKTVKVIGGGRIADGFVVTADVKATLVTHLRDAHHVYVWAFGDSVLDLPMMSRAHQAVVVVGEEHTRSKTMDAALMKAIRNDGLLARQVLLPSHSPPRLDTVTLPVVQLTEHRFITSVLRPRGRQVLHATDRNAAKLLMTPTRDATFAGPALRDAHRRVGWYLATDFLSDMIGVEEYPIPHVQGHQATGHRLRYEQQTSIVALMRGGEPLALGVNDALPLAMFIHARDPDDIKPHHLERQRTVLLVDSVVNSGKTVVDFVQHVRSLYASVRIVVVAGVVQAQSVSSGGLAQALDQDANLHLVALRLSDNKFTGKGTTDTGNRLFNTTHLS